MEVLSRTLLEFYRVQESLNYNRSHSSAFVCTPESVEKLDYFLVLSRENLFRLYRIPTDHFAPISSYEIPKFFGILRLLLYVAIYSQSKKKIYIKIGKNSRNVGRT